MLGPQALIQIIRIVATNDYSKMWFVFGVYGIVVRLLRLLFPGKGHWKALEGSWRLLKALKGHGSILFWDLFGLVFAVKNCSENHQFPSHDESFCELRSLWTVMCPIIRSFVKVMKWIIRRSPKNYQILQNSFHCFLKTLHEFGGSQWKYGIFFIEHAMALFFIHFAYTSRSYVRSVSNAPVFGYFKITNFHGRCTSKKKEKQSLVYWIDYRCVQMVFNAHTKTDKKLWFFRPYFECICIVTILHLLNISFFFFSFSLQCKYFFHSLGDR